MIKIGKSKFWFGEARFQFYYVLLGGALPPPPLSYGPDSNWFDFVRSVAATNQKYNGRNEHMVLVTKLHPRSDLLQRRVAATCRLVCFDVTAQHVTANRHIIKLHMQSFGI